MASLAAGTSGGGRSLAAPSHGLYEDAASASQLPIIPAPTPLSPTRKAESSSHSAASLATSPPASHGDVFASPGGLLTSLLAFLPRKELCVMARVSRACAAATRDEYVWMRAWQWRAEQGRPARAYGSWRAAHMYQALYAAPTFTRVALPESGYEDVTCHLFTQSAAYSQSPLHDNLTVHTRVYGFSDGRVRILQSLPVARDDGSFGVMTLTQEYALGTGSVRHMQATANGARIWVGTWQGCVHCINTRTHAVWLVSPGSGGPVYGLRIVPVTPNSTSAHLYTGCSDGVIRVMCAQSSTALTAMVGHTAAVTDFCVQKVVQAGDAAQVTTEVELDPCVLDAFNPMQGRLPVMTATRMEDLAAVHSSAGSEDDRLHEHGSGGSSPPFPSASAASPVLLTPIPSPRQRSPTMHARAYAREEGTTKVTRRLVSTSYDGTIRVWNLEQMRCMCVLRGHRGPVWSVQVVGDHIITGGADGTVRLWVVRRAAGSDDVLEGTCIRTFDPYTATSRKQVWCVQLVGDYVFSGTSDGYVHCWNVWTGERMWVLHAGAHVDHDGVRRIHVDKSTLYACTAGGFVVVYEMSAPARGLPPINPATAITSVCLPAAQVAGQDSEDAVPAS